MQGSMEKSTRLAWYVTTLDMVRDSGLAACNVVYHQDPFQHPIDQKYVLPRQPSISRRTLMPRLLDFLSAGRLSYLPSRLHPSVFCRSRTEASASPHMAPHRSSKWYPASRKLGVVHRRRRPLQYHIQNKNSTPRALARSSTERWLVHLYYPAGPLRHRSPL